MNSLGGVVHSQLGGCYSEPSIGPLHKDCIRRYVFVFGDSKQQPSSVVKGTIVFIILSHCSFGLLVTFVDTDGSGSTLGSCIIIF